MSRVVLLATGLLPVAAHADFTLNMRRGVTPLSHEIFDLHMTIFWICVAIGAVVFGIMLFSIFKYRRSKGAQAVQFHEHTAVEVIWTIVPVLILVGMAIPATRTLLAIEDTGNPDLTIKVTGFQWRWKYDYMDQGVSFFSSLSTPKDQIENLKPKDANYLLEVDHPLVLPIHKKIRILTTSNDVIHSWWSPDLGVKRDAIPGYINASWARIDKPGVYRGQCAELCGVGHGFMPIVVVAKTEAEFTKWLNGQKQAEAAAKKAATETWSKDKLMARGGEIYKTICAACHQPNGQGVPGAFPALAGSKIVNGPLAGHLDIVLHGKTGTAMQAFGKQMGDSDIASVITFERNSFGNHTGDVVQPQDVAAAR